MSPWASGGHFMSTAEKIRLPDDCTIGYIIESVLGVKLIRSNLFHSHLENLHQVPKTEIHKQVNLPRCLGSAAPGTGAWAATTEKRAWGWTVLPSHFIPRDAGTQQTLGEPETKSGRQRLSRGPEICFFWCWG
nr:PREDICTED: beta-1,3-N-acetylglucosaminyltransferase lunatic fringe [Struthio camelus australis]